MAADSQYLCTSATTRHAVHGQSTGGNKGVGNVWERGFEAEMDMNREAVLNNTAACRHDKTGQRNCQKLMLCGEDKESFR